MNHSLTECYIIMLSS